MSALIKLPSYFDNVEKNGLIFDRLLLTYFNRLSKLSKLTCSNL